MDILDRLQKIEIILTFPEAESEPQAEVVTPCSSKRTFQHIEPCIIHFQSVDLKNLFVSICKSSNLEPFRYASQAPTTLMVHANKSFLMEELIPRFKQCERLCLMLSEKVMRGITSHIYPIEEDYVIAD
jgi:hypothetical protein